MMPSSAFLRLVKVEKHVTDERIRMMATVALTNDDPDAVFVESLQTLDLDLRGERVEILNLHGASCV
jgi:hypothetical protein